MSKDPPRRWSPARLALASGIVSALAVVLTLSGPGVTTDEPLDVRPGRKYVRTLWERGPRFFEPAEVVRVFGDNAEHPPLGRWLLGLASTLGQPFETLALGADPLDTYVLSGRLAPALAFAAMVALVVHTSARRYGTASGLAAGFALAVMPRVFAHAHLGALDTFIALFWVASLLAADRASTANRPTPAMAGAGLVWGLALLTKIHAWFLIPVIFAWSVSRRRGVVPFAVWMVTGLGVFFLGWPWLWDDTANRFLRFLGTGVVRSEIKVLYFGTVYADRDVPWHYPWVYFAVTVPVGLHALGALGLVRAWKGRRDDPFPSLLVGAIGLFLTVFSTRIPVYDGERLFLIVFPLWAVLIGRGFAWLWDRWALRKWARVGLAFGLAAQGFGVVTMHPFGLSYYNALVGGLAGADRLGLEVTYWGDAVDGALLDRLVRELRPDEKAALVPTLYPGQGIATTTRAMARRSLVLDDEGAALNTPCAVVSRRMAYWRPEFRERMGTAQVVYVRSRQGVWLSAVVRFSGQGVGPVGVSGMSE